MYTAERAALCGFSPKCQGHSRVVVLLAGFVCDWRKERKNGECMLSAISPGRAAREKKSRVPGCTDATERLLARCNTAPDGTAARFKLPGFWPLRGITGFELIPCERRMRAAHLCLYD
ncbi:hypothetical protein BaRGS_00010355 [Batillaria attramentaria]|uniref:Uncharacterized protein n=1 Tax=Batillaria attramentaria TaxID=370345 RepID=A0ABD0LFZ3_9CAEN